MKYKNSKKRLLLLLVQILVICYTIVEGHTDAKILAMLLLPIWFIAFDSWRKKC